MQRIDPAPDGKVLVSLPCSLNDRGLADVHDLFDDIQFAERVGLTGPGKGVQER